MVSSFRRTVVGVLVFLGLAFAVVAWSSTPPPSPSASEHLARAVEMIAAGNYRDAEHRLAKLRLLGTPWTERAAFLSFRIAASSGRWDRALAELDSAMPSLSLIGDYALLERARVLRELGRKTEAVETIARLRSRYASSPLMYDARIFEAELRTELYATEESLKVLEPLLARKDPAAMLLAAEYHRKRGELDRAESLCRWICLHKPATGYAGRAETILRETSRYGFSQEEELLRAENLILAGEIAAAEHIYRQWLARDPSDSGLWERLGQCLFKGRRYAEASLVLEKVPGSDGAFLALRAQYRAGMGPDQTLRAIDEVLRKYPDIDSRLYPLRLEVARDLRRIGDTDRAVGLLKGLRKQYPAQDATTRWELAWTYFRRGDLKAAERALGNIRVSDGATDRPRYWKARIMEALGRVRAMETYRSLAASKESGFYGFLAAERVAGAIPLHKEGSALKEEFVPDSNALTENVGLARIGELRLLGMFEEACAELPFLAQEVKKKTDLLALVHLCVELGDYRRSISLAKRLGRFHDGVLGYEYPRGFWPLVVRSAEREGIDPYLVAAVIREESHFDENAVSSAGAVGLMQLLPATAMRNHKGAGVRRPGVGDLKSADVNIPLGAHYLGILLKRYGGDILRSVAAYNAGESAVDRWLNELGDTPADVFVEEIPYRETRHYVRKVLASYRMYRQVWGEYPTTDVAIADASSIDAVRRSVDE